MHIVFQHDKPLPVLKYGGIERLIFWQMKDLVKLGHKVTLLGHPESRLEHLGIQTIATSSSNWQDHVPEDADILHLYYPYLGESSVPVVCYIAGNAKPGEILPINSVFSSASHAKIHNSEFYIHHGIDFDDYPLREDLRERKDWKAFSFLAKTSWKVKNLKDCIRATQKHKKHLFIGGGWKLSLSPRLHWLGMLDDQQSQNLFDRTDAFLWPVLWPEPFGLAPIIAMSRGLPVISSTHGSSPELIRDSKVGILCKSYDEFERVIGERPSFASAKDIRSYAMESFPVRKMSQEFLKAYQKVLSGNTLNESRPRYILNHEADKELLKF